MTDKDYMGLALIQAKKAFMEDEVPIGAIIVRDGEILGKGHNEKEQRRDATAHAEILALQEAMRKVDGWRLTGATIYVTIEPCVMCVGALLQARIKRIVFGAPDPKFGGVISLHRLADDPRHNHRCSYEAGVLEDEAKNLMQEFFKAKR